MSLDTKYVVSVCQGSGVIINPFTDKYSYILTAKHNIQKNIDNPDQGFEENNEIDVYGYSGNKIDIVDRVVSKELDIAILITNDQISSDVIINPDFLDTTSDLVLCGYPLTRRQGKTIGFGSVIYKYHMSQGEKIILKTSENYSYDSLVGYSGGGIFELNDKNDSLALRAISSKKTGSITSEYHGDIDVIQVTHFVSLIEKSITSENGIVLSPLIPYYLSCFSHLKDLVFKLSRSWNDEEKLDDLCFCLREYGVESIKVNLKPNVIREKFENYFNCNIHDPNHTQKIGFWSAFFELLIISTIIDKPKTIDINYIESILKKRRLIFIETRDVWKCHIEMILIANYKGLSNDGAIIVKTLSEDIGYKFENHKLKTLSDTRNISRSHRQNKENIDNINKNTMEKRFLIDLGALNQECLTKGEDSFKSWDIIQDHDRRKLLQIINDKYSSILLN